MTDEENKKREDPTIGTDLNEENEEVLGFDDFDNFDDDSQGEESQDEISTSIDDELDLESGLISEDDDLDSLDISQEDDSDDEEDEDDDSELEDDEFEQEPHAPKEGLFSKRNIILAGVGVVAVGAALGGNALLDSVLGGGASANKKPVPVSQPRDIELPPDSFSSPSKPEPADAEVLPELEEPVLDETALLAVSEQDESSVVIEEPSVPVEQAPERDASGAQSSASEPVRAEETQALFSAVMDNTKAVVKNTEDIKTNSKEIEKIKESLDGVVEDFGGQDERILSIENRLIDIVQRLVKLEEAIAEKEAPKPKPVAKKASTKAAAKPAVKPVNRAQAKKETAKKVAQSTKNAPSVSGKPAPAPKAPVKAPTVSPIKNFAVVATYPAQADANVPAKTAWITDGSTLLEVSVGSSVGSAKVVAINGMNVVTSAGTVRPIR